jgi:O-antigen/teichoic acid export membrane protein
MAEPRPADRLTLDLITSYLAAAAKVGSWAVVLAVVARVDPPAMLALLVFLRTVCTAFNYFSLSLGPAFVQRIKAADVAQRESALVARPPGVSEHVIDYEPVAPPEALVVETDPDLQPGLAKWADIAESLERKLRWCGYAGVFLFAVFFVPDRTNTTQPVSSLLLVPIFVAIGTLMRSVSDAYSGILQRSGHLSRDNSITIGGEALWLAGGFVLFIVFYESGVTYAATIAATLFAATGVGVLHTRRFLVHQICRGNARKVGPANPELARSVASVGAQITLGSLADYLYGPVSMLVVAAFLTTQDAAAYGVAIYFDSVLLLLVAGVAAPLLPRIADASARHDVARVRKLYLTATFACLGVLALAATSVVLLAPWILTVWLKNPPPGVTAILPIVLLHTVIGGTAGVARSVLVGIGAHRAYAVSALLGGLLNVGLGLLFVTQFGMGLAGIAWATVIAVALRCAVWMPWFVLSRLRSPAV